MQVWNIYPLIYIIHIDAIVGCTYIYIFKKINIYIYVYLYCMTSMPIQDPSQSEYEMYKSHIQQSEIQALGGDFVLFYGRRFFQHAPIEIR